MQNMRLWQQMLQNSRLTYSLLNIRAFRLQFLLTLLKARTLLPFAPNGAAICTKRAARLYGMATPNGHFHIVIWALWERRRE